MCATTDDDAGMDIEIVKIVVTITLSIIFYGRGAFPADCFRKLSPNDCDHPQASHEHLLTSGPRLSDTQDPAEVLSSSDPEALVYLRQCNNPRFQSMLANLNQIFDGLARQNLAKIYVCFNDTKQASRGSLLECFTLQFSYAELGDVLGYAHWAGRNAVLLKGRLSDDIFTGLKQVVLSCPELPDLSYTRFFASSINKQTNLEGVWAEKSGSYDIREELTRLKGRDRSTSFRIGTFTCESLSPEADCEAKSVVDQSLPEGLPPQSTPDLPEQWSSPIMDHISSGPSLPASPARPPSVQSTGQQKSSTTRPYRQSPGNAYSQSQTGLHPKGGYNSISSADSSGRAEDAPAQGDPKRRSARHDQVVPVTQTSKARTTVTAKRPRLAMIEEVPEDLPPTQRLQTPTQSRQARISASADPDCFSSDLEDPEDSPSPLAGRNISELLGDIWEAPQETWQAASQSQPLEEANTARRYGRRSEPGGKRAFTMG